MKATVSKCLGIIRLYLLKNNRFNFRYIKIGAMNMASINFEQFGITTKDR